MIWSPFWRADGCSKSYTDGAAMSRVLAEKLHFVSGRRTCWVHSMVVAALAEAEERVQASGVCP